MAAKKGAANDGDDALAQLHWVAGAAPFRELVLRLDDQLAPDLSNLTELTAGMPPAVWAALLAEPGRHLLRAQEFLPSLPNVAAQEKSVGASGGRMLLDSLAYLRMLRAAVGAAPTTGDVVEFGAGWGLFTRLLMKDIPLSRYRGLEPFKPAAALAEATGLGSYITRTRPRLAAEDLPKRASVAFASQVLMVLSPEAIVDNLTLLVDCLAPGGACVVSVRLPEYWLLPPHADPEAVIETQSQGILHRPGRWKDIGETAVSGPWMADQLGKAGLVDLRVDWIPEQPHTVHWSGYREAAGGAA